MLKLCRTKMTLTLPPHPLRPHLLLNNPSLSFLKEMLDNNYSVLKRLTILSDSAIMQIHELYASLEAWHREVTRPSIKPKCTEYDSKLSSS